MKKIKLPTWLGLLVTLAAGLAVVGIPIYWARQPRGLPHVALQAAAHAAGTAALSIASTNSDRALPPGSIPGAQGEHGRVGMLPEGRVLHDKLKSAPSHS